MERRAQEGEDIALVDDARPRNYALRQTSNTRPASAELIMDQVKCSEKHESLTMFG